MKKFKFSVLTVVGVVFLAQANACLALSPFDFVKSVLVESNQAALQNPQGGQQGSALVKLGKEATDELTYMIGMMSGYFKPGRYYVTADLPDKTLVGFGVYVLPPKNVKNKRYTLQAQDVTNVVERFFGCSIGKHQSVPPLCVFKNGVYSIREHEAGAGGFVQIRSCANLGGGMYGVTATISDPADDEVIDSTVVAVFERKSSSPGRYIHVVREYKRTVVK